MDHSKEDLKYIKLALNLAGKGDGTVSPNPMVGAIVVKNGNIIGSGFHKKAGKEHAEVLALKEAGSEARGATLYVSLEPCNHFGKTPPCTEAIISAGIRRVVMCMKDPNPNVTGGGIEKLKEHGIEVETDLMEEQARRLNEKYIYYSATGIPFVILKMGATLDGRIATKTGYSQWITSERARKFAHLLRKSVDAVAVGSGTALKDDPRLTVRLQKKRYFSHRVVFDSHLRISPDAAVFKAGSCGDLIIFTLKDSNREKKAAILKTGAEVIEVGNLDGHTDLAECMQILGGKKITSMLVEGGGRLAASFIKQRFANKLVLVKAPLLIGGGDSIPMVADLGVEKLSDAVKLEDVCWKTLGTEMIFTGYFRYNKG